MYLSTTEILIYVIFTIVGRVHIVGQVKLVVRRAQVTVGRAGQEALFVAQKSSRRLSPSGLKSAVYLFVQELACG